jgi:hypothetical protein
MAQLEDEDVRIANASGAGASLPARHRVQHRRSDHMVASVDHLQYLDGDFGERLNESVNEPLIRIATDVRARVGFVWAGVVNDLRIEPDYEHLEVAPVRRRHATR